MKDLHQKLEAIKANEQMGVTYMKMEERDRIIRLLQEDSSRTDEQTAELMLSGK